MAMPDSPANPTSQGSLLDLVSNLAVTLAASDEALEAVNVGNRARFQELCRTLGLAPMDPVALLCRPPEVTLAKSQVAASVRLSSTKTRETGLDLRIGGRVVDSFYQRRFGVETTTYQRITVALERVAICDDVLVTDGSERGTVQAYLRAFVRKYKATTEGDLAAWVKQAQRFARVQTFRRVLILRAAAGWVCLLPPPGVETREWLSLLLTQAGEVESPAPRGMQVLPTGMRAGQDFATALWRMAVPEMDEGS